MSNGAVPHQFNVPAPFAAIVPGLIALAVGIHLLAIDVYGWIGAILVPVGFAAVLVGVIAKGIAWGIALERQVRED